MVLVALISFLCYASEVNLLSGAIVTHFRVHEQQYFWTIKPISNKNDAACKSTFHFNKNIYKMVRNTCHGKRRISF